MSERDGDVPGAPCWVVTIRPDPDAAVACYRGLFGWDYADGAGYRLAAPAGPRRRGGRAAAPGREAAPGSRAG
jgi:hypothetical protein